MILVSLSHTWILWTLTGQILGLRRRRDTFETSLLIANQVVSILACQCIEHISQNIYKDTYNPYLSTTYQLADNAVHLIPDIAFGPTSTYVVYGMRCAVLRIPCPREIRTHLILVSLRRPSTPRAPAPASGARNSASPFRTPSSSQERAIQSHHSFHFHFPPIPSPPPPTPMRASSPTAPHHAGAHTRTHTHTHAHSHTHAHTGTSTRTSTAASASPPSTPTRPPPPRARRPAGGRAPGSPGWPGPSTPGSGRSGPRTPGRT